MKDIYAQGLFSKEKRIHYNGLRIYEINRKDKKMAAPVPISFYVKFQELNDITRPIYLHELAVNGAKHVVLTSPLLSEVLGKPELLGKIKQELKNEGMSFLDTHAPYGPHWDLNAPYPERAAQAARLKAVMEIVASLELDTMTIHMGNDLVAPTLSAEEHFSRSCSMLEAILPDAERLGITLCIENGMIRNYRTATLLSVLDIFKSDYLGFCFDSGHANVMDKGRYQDDCRVKQDWKILGEEAEWESMGEKIQKMLPYIVNCHLHDNNSCQDEHTLPGKGCVDWHEVSSALRKAPKLRVIQSEVDPFKNHISVSELVSTFDRLFN